MGLPHTTAGRRQSEQPTVDLGLGTNRHLVLCISNTGMLREVMRHIIHLLKCSNYSLCITRFLHQIIFI